MKKEMALGFSLALATFCLFLSPAMAETNLPQAASVLSAADHAFLASLAVPVAPTLAAKRPAVGQKALCNVTANCGNGTVYCEGNNSITSCSGADRNCSAGEQGHVTCDGNTYWCEPACPPPPCPSDYCTLARQACQDNCYPCAISFTCSLSTCTDSCRCRFSTCSP